MNNNLERDRDGWKAAAQAKQTEVEIRGLKANEWKAKAHAKQAEAEMWKKKYERALGRNTTGGAGFNKTAERKNHCQWHEDSTMGNTKTRNIAAVRCQEKATRRFRG